MSRLIAIAFVAWLLFGNGLTTLHNLSGVPKIAEVPQTIADGARRLAEENTSAPPATTNPAAVRDLLDRIKERGYTPAPFTATLSTTAKIEPPAVLTNIEPRSPVNDTRLTERPINDTALIVDAVPAIEQGAPVEVPINAGAFEKSAPAPAPPVVERPIVEAPPVVEAPAAPVQAPSDSPVDKCAQSPAACASGG